MKDTLEAIKGAFTQQLFIDPKEALKIANDYTFNVIMLDVLVDIRDQIALFNRNFYQKYEETGMEDPDG